MKYKKNILFYLLNLFYAVTALSSSDYYNRLDKGGFAPGTKILGFEEDFLDIEESVFISLIAADPEGFEPEPMVQVKEVMRHEVSETFKLNFQGISESLVLAPDQKILVRIQQEGEDEPKSEWIEAQNLELGAEVFARRGQIRIISGFERVEANQETFEDSVYAIELNKIHTFYVGEKCQIVAHNVVGAAISFTWNIGQGLAASVPQILAASFAASIITDICEENAREHGASGSAITPQDITDHIASKLKPKETKVEVKEEEANKAKEKESTSSVPKSENSNSGLGHNPFKSKSREEIVQMMKDKGFTPKGRDPVNGEGAFVNPKTGRQYHIDLDHAPPKGPHIGVSRPREFAKENKKVPKDKAIKKTEISQRKEISNCICQ